METVYIDQNDPNFFDEYTVEVRKDKEEWIEFSKAVDGIINEKQGEEADE